jgi:hypothetical protein
MKVCPAMIVCAVWPIRGASHRSEPVLELAVVGLDAVVGVAFDVVPRRRNQLVEDCRIHRRRVGDHLGRSHLQCGQRPADEPVCRCGVAAGGDEHVDDRPSWSTAR